jgi:hypothetical protein
LTAYSQDLLEELDRELTDVYPAAKDLLYYFLDGKPVMTKDQLDAILTEAGIPPEEFSKIVDFLLYYGVVGVQIGEQEHFIYSVNYDLKVLNVRAERGKEGTRYVLNPAFWPAFGMAA